jgi:UDP-N-acetylglucosamine--N-acetylmuramyl-(pentapeptide) pyrophosphoryl-undecaprenol N-acetylglucosamine transferase
MVRKVYRMVVTGGGTGGHVFPAIRVAKAFQRTGTDILYIGSAKGIEKSLCKEANIRFKSVKTGKFRRYFSWQNFIDPFNIFSGILKSYIILKRYEPEVVFSKGGYVSVPVVFSAWVLNIPVILHESDITPGLANRMMIPFSSKICVSFYESLKLVPSGKAVFTGNPIREELFHGDVKKGRIVAGFDEGDSSVPVILFLGGSLGAQEINNLVFDALPLLTEFSKVILQAGKGKLINISNLKHKDRFFQFEFVGVKALANFYKLSDIIVSRAGAGQITELAFLSKPSILIPLSKDASRGDQIVNANLLLQEKAAIVLEGNEVTKKKLLDSIEKVLTSVRIQTRLKKNIQMFYNKDAVRDIMKVIRAAKR